MEEIELNKGSPLDCHPSSYRSKLSKGEASNNSSDSTAEWRSNEWGGEGRGGSENSTLTKRKEATGKRAGK